MARRGRKPKPTLLRLVDGTHRTDRHGDRTEAEKTARAVHVGIAPLERPACLKGEARKAWKQYIEPFGMLDPHRMPAAIAFCELWASFRSSPHTFTAALHAQMRRYLADCGLTDERNRRTGGAPAVDEFFS